MTLCLKRLASSILLHYDDGRASKGLVGENFRLDTLQGGVLLRIDLSNNFELRNRGLYCHRAARIFTRAHAQVVGCQIHDRALSSTLHLMGGRVGAAWQLEFEARKRSFRYAARPLWEQGHMSFLLEEMHPREQRGPQRHGAHDDLHV